VTTQGRKKKMLSIKTCMIIESLRNGMHPQDAAAHYKTGVQYMYGLCATYHIPYETRAQQKQRARHRACVQNIVERTAILVASVATGGDER
jgi:hypothetical protein